MSNPVDLKKVQKYQRELAKLALFDPASEAFETEQAKCEALWAELSIEEKALAHENNTTNL